MRNELPQLQKMIEDRVLIDSVLLYLENTWDGDEIGDAYIAQIDEIRRGLQVGRVGETHEQFLERLVKTPEERLSVQDRAAINALAERFRVIITAEDRVELEPSARGGAAGAAAAAPVPQVESESKKQFMGVFEQFQKEGWPQKILDALFRPKL